MGSALSHSALKHYRQNGTGVVTTLASPHRLIGMLYDGALERLAAARGSLQRGDLGMRHQQLGEALAIVEHLRATLDESAGGDVARNLGKLYDYMVRRLTLANADSDVAGVEEVIGLLHTLKSAWDAMPQAVPRL